MTPRLGPYRRAATRWRGGRCHTARVTGPVDVDDGTTRLLRAATDRSGGGPLPWSAAPLRNADRVLELCCGTGRLAGDIAPGRWVGVDSPLPPCGRIPRLAGEATALPLRTSSVDGVALLLALPSLRDVDGMFAELRRVLRPGGTLVVVVPSAVPRSLAELRLAPLLSPVHRAWQHRSALDRASWLLSAADFALLGDDRVSFALPVPDAAAARELVDALPRAGLWPPDLPADVRERVATGLARRAGRDRVLPLPLRRLVARR